MNQQNKGLHKFPSLKRNIRAGSKGPSHPVAANSQVDADVRSDQQLPDVPVALLRHLFRPHHVALQAHVLFGDRKLCRSAGQHQNRVLSRWEPEESRKEQRLHQARSLLGGPSDLLMHSLLHPLRLVVSTEINTTKQDRLVKVHINIVPEWTKWVTILKTVQNSLNGRRRTQKGRTVQTGGDSPSWDSSSYQRFAGPPSRSSRLSSAPPASVWEPASP